MIYLLYGDNTAVARKKLREILDLQLKKDPQASYFKFDDENFDVARLEEFTQSQGLFQNKYIVVLDGVLQGEKAKEAVFGKIKDLEASQNIFIILEVFLKKDVLTKIEKRSEKIQKFELIKKPEAKKNTTIFELTDALGNRDKKKLWVLYEKQILGGVEPAEMHGILFWQVKAMLASKVSNNVADSGLNPNVHRKSLLFAKNFTLEELTNLSRGLLTMYHDNRRGLVDFDTAMELWVLGL
jgi:DNA polymerase III delta subunit